MRVAIVGYDVEGQASYRYFSQQNTDITIFDEAPTPRATPPDSVTVVSGKDALTKLHDAESFDVVLRTPSLAPSKLRGVKNVTSATQEFFAKCPAPIIGVTGTKGKGTTSSFIASILRAAGETVHLLGNIGTPALDVLSNIDPKDIVVFEMSSFQLWDMKCSPHVAVVLMIEPDHLDVHSSMGDYVSAKTNICRWQKTTDVVVYNPQNSLSEQIASTSSGARLAYGQAPAAYIKDGSFYVNEQKICSTSTVVIPGKHNLENAMAAITAAWQFVRDPAAVTRGLAQFEGLPHRLKFVREVNNIKFYDDSIATTPGSVAAAVRSFEQPKVMIVGGSKKGADFDGLVEVLAAKDSSVASVVCIGETGPTIERLLRKKGFTNTQLLPDTMTMTDIVAAARDQAKPDDVIILSPACASFDMFKSYADRGDQFVAAVHDLSTTS